MNSVVKKVAAPLDGYQRRLFAFLSVAAFFEGYDFFALTQILPHLRREMHLDEIGAGWLVGVINGGTVLAYLMVKRADRFGRRQVLSLTIVGYALLTMLSGLAPNVWFFGAFQMLARIFLIGEWATSMVMAAEEYPAERRGTVIGVISATTGLGAVLCAGVAPVLTHAFGWRSVYFVGVLPLILVAFLRRNLHETRRFAAQGGAHRDRDLFSILRSPYRRRVLELGLVWFLTYLCTQNAVTFWKDHALNFMHWDDGKAGTAIKISALVAMPIVFFAGKFLDVVGRRLGASVIMIMVSVGTFGAYSLTSFGGIVASLTLAVVGINSVLTVLNAFTTEVFPTEFRGDAFAWSNNLLGRLGYWLSPIGIGYIAKFTGWAPVMRVTSIFPLIAMVFVLLWFPETRSKELEESARV